MFDSITLYMLQLKLMVLKMCHKKMIIIEKVYLGDQLSYYDCFTIMSYPHNLTLVRKLRGLTLLLCAESSSRCQHNHIMCYLRLCAIKFIIQVMNLNVVRVSLRTTPMEQNLRTLLIIAKYVSNFE